MVEVGVSLVRVRDSRVRGRGLGQGVPAINGRSSTAFAGLAPSPKKHWGNKHALPPFVLEKDNTAAILFRRTKRRLSIALALAHVLIT